MSVEAHGNIAYLSSAQASVSIIAESFAPSAAPQVADIVTQFANSMNVAPWGENNLFPQLITQHMDACGVGKAVLDFKARSLWGSGFVFGRVTGINADGTEIFQVAQRSDPYWKEVFSFFDENDIPQYFSEYAVDWCYFSNTFPELVLNKAKTKIVRIYLQEASDCRFKQMGPNGKIDTVYISKVWGMTNEQIVKFFPKKTDNPQVVTATKALAVDGKYVHQRTCLDKYDTYADLVAKAKRGITNFILPIQYSSPGKAYYQLAAWDGARVSGWTEIAAKIPSMLVTMYKKAFSIKYHIEIPEAYFSKRIGQEAWDKYTTEQRKAAREEVLQAMDNFLSGDENAYKTFISYFDTHTQTQVEHNRIKITAIDSKSNIDKDLLASGTANSEICIAMGVNPNTLGAGKPGGVFSSNQGGSNIREGKITHDSLLNIDRLLALKPFNLIKRFNQWPEDLEFRFKDTVLLTLDKGAETKTNLS